MPINDILSRALDASNAASSVKAIEEVRVQFLGKSGELTGQLKTLGALSPDERKLLVHYSVSYMPIQLATVAAAGGAMSVLRRPSVPWTMPGLMTFGVAGAGAGKTKTLVYRILRLIRQGVAPSEIMAITFTNKAAKEMRERVGHLLGKDPAAGPWVRDGLPFVSTFHALGVYLIREEYAAVGVPKRSGVPVAAFKQALASTPAPAALSAPTPGSSDTSKSSTLNSFPSLSFSCMTSDTKRLKVWTCLIFTR